MKRFEVIESRVWRDAAGRTASIYGAYPGAGFELVCVGWTVRDVRSGVVGVGRAPWTTREQAEEWVAAEEERRAGAVAILGKVLAKAKAKKEGGK